MAGTLQPWRLPLRLAFETLCVALNEQSKHVERIVNSTYLVPPFDPNFFPADTYSNLAGAALLSVWLAGRANNVFFEDVRAADKWFFPTEDGQLSAFVPDGVVEQVAKLLSGLPSGSKLEALLPYLLEAFNGEGLAAVRDRGSAWQAKRESGVFYTPSDVADFIVRSALAAPPPGRVPMCLDPACGTGVFLRSALLRIEQSSQLSRPDVCRYLFGIDISPLAVQSAAFVLFSSCLSQVGAITPPVEHWLRIRRNFAVWDSTTIGALRFSDFLHDALSLPDLFPLLADGSDVVIGNPPYSKLPLDGKHVLRRHLFRSAPESTSGYAYPLFVEMMWRFAKSSGASAGMVVPLSISYQSGSQFQALRREIECSGDEWRFYFFDRTPDSLFGDDTKTRNAIAVMHRREGKETRVFSSAFHRWSSRSRTELFHSLSCVRLTDPSIREMVPKLGTELEERVYRSLRLSNRVLSDSWVGSSGGEEIESSPNSIFYYATAYNWLPIIRNVVPVMLDHNEGRTPSSLRAIDAGSIENAEFSFSVLVSRVAYWLWRVEGDGFHLTRRFLGNIPIHPERFDPTARAALCCCGRRFWEGVSTKTIVSQNSGITTVNFTPEEAIEVLDELDEIIVGALGLPFEFASFAKQFQSETIDAGRNSERLLPASCEEAK